MSDHSSPSLSSLLGPTGRGICSALKAAAEFLRARDVGTLLQATGKTLGEIPRAKHLDKRFLQASYRGDESLPPDDLLTGQGLFFLTEQRKLFLDCTAGHYQMTWGYRHPELETVLREGLDAGLVWDDHSDMPGNAVKMLSQRLVEAANGALRDLAPLLADDHALATVLLGICTGSVAGSSALKIALRHHETVRPGAAPVLIALRGNYHGTDFLTQRMRGMWPDYFRGITFVQIEPNDQRRLQQAFAKHHGRVAAMFVEPILMNREAIRLEEGFLREARRLCDGADACLVIDEIQTGFWCPEVFMYHQYGILPDIVMLGKGMTAGVHPLSAVIYRRRYDRLAQYDAISTNGGAPLAALAGLCCLALLARDQKRIAALAKHYFHLLEELPVLWPARVAAIHGGGFLAGIKFHAVADALEFHRRCVDRGLWVRVHACQEGHSTVLTKLALAADRQIVDFVSDTFRQILGEMA